MSRQALHPQVEEAVAAVNLAGLSIETLTLYRQPFPEMPLSEAVDRTDQVAPGHPDVALRVHRPRGAEGDLPCVYSIHGGGYVLGSNRGDDVRFDNWCPRLGIVGVSVEYRLAPETSYPGPLEDCYRGLQWVFEHAAELGIDPGRIGISGLSAGGGLAAGVALTNRDRGDMSIAFQLLDSPMLDDRQRTPSSQLDGLAVWPREANTFGWRCYLGELYGTEDVPYTAAPARCPDLSGLPPTFVSVGSVDGFRDEDIDYALRLNQAGVPCELHVYPGASHAYQVAAGSPVARQSAHDQVEWLDRQIHLD